MIKERKSIKEKYMVDSGQIFYSKSEFIIICMAQTSILIRKLSLQALKEFQLLAGIA